MASTKEMIALSTASVAEKMREWVRASYDYYDQFPDAFSYVFFTEHAFGKVGRKSPPGKAAFSPE